MPRWTTTEYAAYQARRLSSRAQPEQAVQHEPMAKKERKAIHSNQVRCRITSFRRRLLDPDNICPKYFIDCLRYAEIIPNDREEDIILEVRQEKVTSKSSERTEIVIKPITLS